MSIVISDTMVSMIKNRLKHLMVFVDEVLTLPERRYLFNRMKDKYCMICGNFAVHCQYANKENHPKIDD